MAPRYGPQRMSPRLLNELLWRLDARLADHPAPFLLLGAHEGGELLGRVGGGIGAAGAQLLADLGRVVGAHQFTVQRLYDAARRSRGDEDAVPHHRLESGDARLRG